MTTPEDGLHEALSLLDDALRVQRFPCDHAGIGKPGCAVCDPRTYTSERAALTGRYAAGVRVSEDAGPPVANPDPGLAYDASGVVVGRVAGWIGCIPVLAALRPTPAAPKPDHESWCHREHVGHCVDGPATAHPSTPAAPQPDTALTADDAECPTCSGHFHHMWPCPAIQRCEVHGCDREADCGTPTDDGYKRVCGRHFAEFLALGDKP